VDGRYPLAAYRAALGACVLMQAMAIAWMLASRKSTVS
jgi:hypothetical protein